MFLSLLYLNAYLLMSDKHGVRSYSVLPVSPQDYVCVIKPENILMDGAGHLKICDFGLALENMCIKTAIGEAGTLCYIAPEGPPREWDPEDVESYNAAVDWWTFEVIIFKMARGTSPFYHDN
ncbi:kinase C delta type-like [Pelobates cultripes]|uniref:Kinase C delta type-like n=1 Tax=Pelobates cultripes TaxID=61616 RepID=A0AAD1WDS5_PELCU|nr:kinase C delta type-like [Pelobates cultripes]